MTELGSYGNCSDHSCNLRTQIRKALEDKHWKTVEALVAENCEGCASFEAAKGVLPAPSDARLIALNLSIGHIQALHAVMEKFEDRFGGIRKISRSEWEEFCKPYLEESKKLEVKE